jgi:multidrug efflux pump subunit AcrA (membrane-fusion protein)
MTLVRRVKGEMTPLPDGVIARVQLSPYRIELAGIRTLPLEYRRLEQEVIAAGRIETAPGGKLILTANLFEADAVLLHAGLSTEITCDAFPGEEFAGRLAEAPALSWGQESRVQIAIDESRGRLHAGQLAYARFRVPAARIESEQIAAVNRWRDHTAVEIFASGIGGDALPVFGSLIEGALALAPRSRDLTLSVPEDAVIDTGTRKVVFVESMPGMFDAIEVQVGRRCGNYFPVRSGLAAGQQVVTAGSVLLDAQTRLDPSVAASYFGTGTRATMPAPKAPPVPGTMSPEDRVLAERQKICPVTDAPLDSMGGPVRVVVNGKPVFICCEGCREKLLKTPAKYLSKLANK